MIEQIIKEYLEQKIQVPVVLEIPAKPPNQFLLIERIGGGAGQLLCSPMIAIQSYGASLLEAAQLNERVKTAMEQLAEMDPICSVKLNTDYNFTNPATKQYRYQAVFNITHYKEE